MSPLFFIPFLVTPNIGWFFFFFFWLFWNQWQLRFPSWSLGTTVCKCKLFACILSPCIFSMLNSHLLVCHSAASRSEIPPQLLALCFSLYHTILGNVRLFCHFSLVSFLDHSRIRRARLIPDGFLWQCTGNALRCEMLLFLLSYLLSATDPREDFPFNPRTT